MKLEDYGVWFKIDKTREDTKWLYVEENDTILDQSIRALDGTSFHLLKHGKHIVHARSKGMTEWEFRTFTTGVNIGIDVKYEPFTVRDFLKNIRPWIFK